MWEDGKNMENSGGKEAKKMEKKKIVTPEAAKACSDYEAQFATNAEAQKDILEGQTKIIEALSEITSFMSKMCKREYEDENGVKKDGPLWDLMKQGKKIGAF